MCTRFSSSAHVMRDRQGRYLWPVPNAQRAAGHTNRCDSKPWYHEGSQGARCLGADVLTWIELVRAWPMCRAPVTLGGGMTMTNGGLSLLTSGLKKPHFSHHSYLQCVRGCCQLFAPVRHTAAAARCLIQGCYGCAFASQPKGKLCASEPRIQTRAGEPMYAHPS